MAGDWIPMRANLEDDPTVIAIARALKLQPDHVVGKLHRFWSWADSHTIDGQLCGVDAAWVDKHVDKRGFANAMASAPTPWLVIEDCGIRIPNFTNWFGSSAKSRMLATRRQQVSRSQRDNCHGTSVTETRLQNRTEQKRLIAPALGGAEISKAKAKALEITGKLGQCGTARNRRLLLGACVLSEELGEAWLNTAVRETQEAHPEKPYAYFQSVLVATAEAAGVDFRASVAALDFPEAPKGSTSVPQVQHA